MGPPIFIGGNMVTYIDYGACYTQLQWGRRFSSAEMRTKDGSLISLTARFNGAADFHRRKLGRIIAQHRGDRQASMGPPIFIGGNVAHVQHGHMHPRHASMGPPIIIGGNHHRRPLEFARHLASMGPPIFIGGNKVG